MCIGRPLLSFQQIYTGTNTAFFTCTKLVSADMLERNCCTFVLDLTTGLNNYRPIYVATGCTKQHRNSCCWKSPLGVSSFRTAAKRFSVVFISPPGRNLGKITNKLRLLLVVYFTFCNLKPSCNRYYITYTWQFRKHGQRSENLLKIQFIILTRSYNG